MCSLRSNFSSKLVPTDTVALCSTKMGLYLNNFHLPCHIHLYRLHRFKLCGDLWITKRKMSASGCGPLQVNIVEFGGAKWEMPRNALFCSRLGVEILRNCSQRNPTFNTWLQLPGYISSLSRHCIGMFIQITHLLTWDMQPFICIQ